MLSSVCLGYVWEVWSIPGVFQTGRWWKMAAGPQDRGKHTCTHLISCERWLLATILLKLSCCWNTKYPQFKHVTLVAYHVEKLQKHKRKNYGEDDRDEDGFCVFVFSVCRLWRTIWIQPGRSSPSLCRLSATATLKDLWRFHQLESTSVHDSQSNV